jgi:hypothetical protein
MHVTYVYPWENIARISVYKNVATGFESERSESAFIEMEVSSRF